MCADGPVIKLKPIVPGDCSGELLVLDRYMSFFGEVDPVTGCLREQLNVCIAGKVLAFRGCRGSTVAPYVLYALKKSSKSPICMLVKEVEPMLVAGCVLGEIPLYVFDNYQEILKIPNGAYVEIRNGELRVYK